MHCWIKGRSQIITKDRFPALPIVEAVIQLKNMSISISYLTHLYRNIFTYVLICTVMFTYLLLSLNDVINLFCSNVTAAGDRKNVSHFDLVMKYIARKPKEWGSQCYIVQTKILSIFLMWIKYVSALKNNGKSHRNLWVSQPTKLHLAYGWFESTSNTPLFSPTLLTTPNSRSNASHILAQQCHKFPPIWPLPLWWSAPPTTLHFPGPNQPNIPNGIQICSAIFPELTGQKDTQTWKVSAEYCLYQEVLTL